MTNVIIRPIKDKETPWKGFGYEVAYTPSVFNPKEYMATYQVRARENGNSFVLEERNIFTSKDGVWHILGNAKDEESADRKIVPKARREGRRTLDLLKHPTLEDLTKKE